MYCFRCGKKLPPRVINCPECDTPQKRRQRYRRRMILGLFIFLAGAVAGSLFDTFFFRGQAWDHSFIDLMEKTQNASNSTGVAVKASETASLHENVSEPESAVATTSKELMPALQVADTATAVVSPDIATAPEEPAQTLETEPQAENIATSSVTSESSLQPAKLSFDHLETLVKEKSSSYHGFMSKDHKEVVFASDKLKVDGKKRYQCFVKKIGDSQEAKRMFAWPGNIWTPELTPDGKLVVFSSDSRKHEHIFVYDRQTEKSKALTAGLSKNMMPAISPDGTLIAYVSNEKGSNDIWLLGIDGSNKIQITNTEHDDREPRWLPDGRGLVFTRIITRLKESNIMKIVLDPMGEARPLIEKGGRNWLAAMSPAGRNLAFVRSMSNNGSNNTLIVKDLKTDEEKQIKPLGAAECFRPVWNAADEFVFHANVDGSKNIYKAVFKREIDD